ncbi:predicted protein [Scheffersomyces stipitis CBS 6054]|uniref:Restriction of telomere capping protein 1 n=1 Tax=Scheffersomyces stipitis (strain ATCC 58785 / CBS 6054 / NBRC 10063 / NRRL Y-11545) TaxID=322104 RepID=RTC1_PICST|nr:predicted protein [Scheffersomyces stipitis CBS 6054]A3GIA4.2 RecName: Full=Restriction of telomere capping protein 1 [Scheffersomyces stipitis CBS 6054]EAZ63199.2 predicted protein [Scheffersomyces stipitis CBS 6054]
MSSNANSQHSTLAKFAFNIYGSLNHATPSYEGSASPSSSYSSSRSKTNEPYNYRFNKLVYNCEREVTTLSQLNYPLSLSNTFQSDQNLSHHVIIGGRNYLKLLALNEDQSRIVQDINVLDQSSIYTHNSRVPSTNKLNNINTVKAQSDTIGCGLSNGLITVYKVGSNGKCRLIHKFSDHKRCINSLDYVGIRNLYDAPTQMISGSQDGSIKLWDMRSSSPRPMLTISSGSHSDPIRSCQYSPHSQGRNKLVVLSVHDSGALCKFDLRLSNGHGPERKWNIHTGPALSLHIHPEKEYVVTGGRDQKICVFNYGDSQISNRITPDEMINTYGPVMKVRWCLYPDASTSQFGEPLDTFQQSNDFNSSSLYSYDLACSYLNDDSTVAIYNLNRKFIPKEVITTSSNKPIQNFIWANNPGSSRKIWTITKSNVFSSYDLDMHDSLLESEISKPLDELANVTVDWNNGFGDLCLANQEKYEFEITEVESQASDNDMGDIDTEYSSRYERSNSNSVIDESSLIGSSSAEKPPLFRSSTHYSMHMAKSPSPVPRRGSTSFAAHSESQPNLSNMQGLSMSRPKLTRNLSQATEDSSISIGSAPQSNIHLKSKRSFQVSYASPYLVPVSLPLSLNDENVFEILSNNYLISIPDGFTLVDVCLLNASVAASVQRFRECQIWRVLAVSLEEDYVQIDNTTFLSDPELEHNETNQDEKIDDQKDAKSISSDLGNFVGSYNSNSTSTTNYGGLGSLSAKDTTKANNSNNLMDMINRSRVNSMNHLQSISPSGSHTFIRNAIHENKSNENAIVDDDETDAAVHGTEGRIGTSHVSEDLDNENLNILNNAVLNSSPNSAMTTPHPQSNSPNYSNFFSLPKLSSTFMSPIYDEFAEKQEQPRSLKAESLLNNDVSDRTTTKSELTKAIKEEVDNSSGAPLKKAWKSSSLLEKALAHASNEGDIILCSTLSLLFYDSFKQVIPQSSCLDWLGLYIEILQRKRLFVNAIHVVNNAPDDVRSKLKNLTSGDVDLRFFCCWCQKLLVNEKSKEKLKNDVNADFGYWYCDECSQKQSNCIYCNEPCKGLTVVVSLKCGHRGHFGCLREWFIEDENNECPGGCDYSVV